ncbi:oligopeptide ABC transporter substrate-binding protein OppA [Vibrio anguillarum]|uniref:ABC transporter substrate-binding protein n=2 Tax=Vibrio anguillarum TaxID=55601 RepID=UPI000DFA8B01|nr:ABC transporter substrate-binding protein [Vibrio anguillarum]MBF4444655.1 oligopeptide ABC transporter substrate-binding protein OppA [Vibrio anguillarum]MBY7670383.1 oligopeptide ABC transporter substrate-binding protein OppA [Vibrio anguillarum]STY94233.1 Periplasmic oligopeptide-binding protein precursor [Vibrio anguillarum]
MYKNKITQALLLGAGMAVADTSTFSLAADVPAGTKLAKVQELVRGNGTEVATLDPHKSQGVPESNVIRDILEGLVNQDGKGNTIPGVAESWETADNKTFIFHLRKNAKWSNGDPVTAHDFVYSLQRTVDPATASPYSWYMEYTKMLNAKDIIEGKKDKSTLGVKALNDYTLEVQLDEAVPYFVMMAGHTIMKPVHKATIEKYGDQWTKPEHFVGNGAFKVNTWVVNERLVLTRNPQYWENNKTILDKVTYLPIENQVAEMNRFLAGEIDFTAELPIEHFKRLRKEHPESVAITGLLSTYYYQFNTKKKPFDDVRVRKALSYAIDRNIITDAILGQGQKPAYFLTPEITAGFNPVLPDYGKMSQKERNKEAQSLLKEAGFDSSNRLAFTFLYNTSENHKKLAVAAASMWKKTLDVDVVLENQEWKTYLDTKDQGNFEVARAGWAGDYNEPSTFLTLMTSSNTSAGTHYGSKEYDEIINKALTSTSQQERESLYVKAEEKLVEDMPIIPIYQYVRARLLNPQVGGFAIDNAEEKIYSKDLYIKAK